MTEESYHAVLHHYSERLSKDIKEQLIASVQDGAHSKGFTYAGTAIDVRMPKELTALGIPQLRPQHFVCGGLLTPVGKLLADMVIEDEADDDYRL